MIAMLATALAAGPLAAEGEDRPPNNLHPAWSPDSASIAYLERGTETTNIRVVDVATGKSEVVATDVGGLANPAFSPNGESLVFVTSAADEHGQWCLVVLDIVTRKTRAIHTSSKTLMHPQWSPDGGAITFVRIGESGSDVFAIQLDSKTIDQLTKTIGVSEFHPKWRPDGEALVFDRHVDQCETDDCNYLVELSTVDGTEIELLTGDHSMRIGAPSYASDPRSIIFSRSDPVLGGLWRLSLDSGKVVDLRLDNGGRGTGGPVSSPNGRWIAFHAAREREFNIFVAKNDATDERRLTNW